MTEEGPLPKRKKTLMSPPPLPTTSSLVTRSSQIKIMREFKEWSQDVKTWSSLDDDFVSVVTTVVQEVSRPSMDDKTRNVSIWLDDECVDCAGRRRRSGLKRRLESVNWHEIAERKKCADVSRRVMSLVSQAVEAAKSGFKNGDIKMFALEILSLGYDSWLCSKHLCTVVKKMPGTIHDTSAMNIKGMWKADGVVQLSEEIELTGLPDVIIVLDGLNISNTTVTIAELKKDSWMDKASHVNRIAKGDLENSEMGQLLSYMFGTVIQSIQDGNALHRLLGIFVEGRKAVLVRAVVDREVNEQVVYSITFGHTAVGSHAIDLFTSKGILSVILMATRFVSSQVLDDESSTVSTSASDTD